MGSSSKNFLDHARENEHWAPRLYDSLQSSGSKSWVATTAIPPGTFWDVVVRKEIKVASWTSGGICAETYSLGKKGV